MKNLPKAPEGYLSLITAEEYKAIEELHKALNNYLEVHNKCVMENVELIDKVTTYARTQYLMLGDLADTAQETIIMMVGIHNLSKDLLDELSSERCNGGVEDLEVMLMMKKLERKLDI